MDFSVFFFFNDTATTEFYTLSLHDALPILVRHLISIPAGIVRMNFGLFSLVTIAGSALWCWILAYLGDKAYRLEPELLTSPDALVRFIHGQSKGILLVVALFAALYMLSLRLMKPRSSR